jgi:hypothetical protein
VQRGGTPEAFYHAGVDPETDIDQRADPFGTGVHHGVGGFGRDLPGRDPGAQQLPRLIHAQAGDDLRIGHQLDLPLLLDRPQRIHDRV